MDEQPKQAGPVLVLTGGGNRVDPGKVGKQLGAGEVRKANASEARAATGYAIGGTPPFGTHVFAISPADLVRASGGGVCDVAEVLAGMG